MTEPRAPDDGRKGAGERVVYWLALGLVLVGLTNAMPGIPGLDDWVRDVTGDPWFNIRKFPFEYYYPFFFALMMLTVALHHSMWRAWRERSAVRRGFGLFMDVALVVMALTISVTYMNELEAICLADQFTGDRARLIEESLKIQKENAAIFGLPEPTTVEDPKCLNSVGGWLVAIVGVAIVIFLGYNVKVWGLPLVLVAIAVAGYTIAPGQKW